MPYWKYYSQLITQPFPDEAIELVLQYMANTPSPPSNFFCSSFGGAVRNAPSGGSAFPHRDALFYCEPGAAWDDPALHAKAIGWAAEFWRALRPYGNEIILLIKGSAVVAIITVFDLMGETRYAFSQTYDYQTYLWAAIFYLSIVEALRHLWAWFEARLTRHLKR